MRKVAFTLFLFIGYSVCFAQANHKATRFKLLYYQSEGKSKEIRDEPIKDKFTLLDLYFIDNRFCYIPLPKAFIDKKHKSEVVESTLGTTRESKRSVHVEYDKASRVITYAMSGCFICSDLGYVYDVKYNIAGQITQLIPSSKWGLMPSSDEYKIEYNTNGDVKSVDVIQDRKIAFQAILQ